MALSRSQKGAVGQFTFLAVALATGAGEVEAYAPVADNEGRDAEIRRHLKSRPGISVQVKVAFSFSRPARAKRLDIVFAVSRERLQNDPRLWYFFAYYDRKQLRFCEPVFLVPARIFHKMGGRGLTTRGQLRFGITASLAEGSRDKWSRFRVAPRELGNRLLELVDSARPSHVGTIRALPSEGIWFGRRAA